MRYRAVRLLWASAACWRTSSQSAACPSSLPSHISATRSVRSSTDKFRNQRDQLFSHWVVGMILKHRNLVVVRRIGSYVRLGNGNLDVEFMCLVDYEADFPDGNRQLGHLDIFISDPAFHPIPPPRLQRSPVRGRSAHQPKAPARR